MGVVRMGMRMGMHYHPVGKLMLVDKEMAINEVADIH